MTAARMVCGDPPGVHRPGCKLFEAEIVALEAAMKAPEDDGHRLIVVLGALANAGLLRDLADIRRNDILLGVIDTLWEFGLITGSACDVCGAATDTAPECTACGIREDAAAMRREDRP